MSTTEPTTGATAPRSRPVLVGRAWDQQEGESNAAYARFLAYRNLGTTRSLRKAYARHVGKKVSKGVRPPGQWQQDSVAWNWHERARAWDVEMLLTESPDAVLAAHTYARRLILCALERLEEKGAAPGQKGWKDHLATLKLFAAVITPEAVERLVSSHRARTETPGEDPARPGAPEALGAPEGVS